MNGERRLGSEAKCQGYVVILMLCYMIPCYVLLICSHHAAFIFMTVTHLGTFKVKVKSKSREDITVYIQLYCLPVKCDMIMCMQSWSRRAERDVMTESHGGLFNLLSLLPLTNNCILSAIHLALTTSRY